MMKIVIQEWLKCRKAIAVMLLTIAVSAVNAWAAMQCTILIPKVVLAGELRSHDTRMLIAVSILIVALDSVYMVMESKSYRMFFTKTCDRFMRILVDARYELYTKYSLAHITHIQGFIQDASYVGKTCIRIASNLIRMLLSAWAIFTLAPIEVICMIAVMYLVMACCVRPFYKRVGLCDMRSKEIMKERDQIVENVVYGFAEVRLANTQDYEYERVVKKNVDVYAVLNKKNRYNGLLMFGASGMDGLGTILTVGMGIGFVASGRMEVASALSVVQLAGILLGGLMNIMDLVDSASDITSRAESWKTFIDDAQRVPEDGDIEMEPLEHEIVVDDVSFSYGDTKSTLNHCSMVFPAGRKIGICGKSGDGKSTLLKLLCNFYQPVGRITFDGIEIRELKRKSLYREIGLVSQEINIFPGTIRENITYGREDASEHAVIEACKKAGLYDFVMGLEHQLQTEVGPRGVKLSGGQRQRIALARVFLNDPSIIILDEATSALDNISEKIVQKAIEEMKGKTIIMVAHRLTTIEKCDKIYVMNGGRVAEEGTHEELKQMGGIYTQMLNASVE